MDTTLDTTPDTTLDTTLDTTPSVGRAGRGEAGAPYISVQLPYTSFYLPMSPYGYRL